MKTAPMTLLGWIVLACACGGSGGATQSPPDPTEHDPCVTDGRAALDGTVCGEDRACRGGVCAACVDGAACVPAAAPCHAGRLACGATPTCVDTGAVATDGTTCGVDEVCSHGQCTSCVEGQICQTGGPCYYQSRLSCAQGPMCLNLLGNFPDGSTCVTHGKIGTCSSGQCIP